MPAILRSILAVLAGFFLTAFLSLGMDGLVCAVWPHTFEHAATIQHPSRLVVPLVYTAVFAAVGCYAAARLAGRRPMLHAMILGGIALAISLPITLQAWGSEPSWYLGGALALLLPAAWLGGWLAERTQSRPAAMRG